LRELLVLVEDNYLGQLKRLQFMTPDDTHRGKIAIKILRGGNGKKRGIIAYLAFFYCTLLQVDELA